MASVQSIAIAKEKAYESLEHTTKVLAEYFGVNAPDLNIHKRYSLEYRNAQELLRMATFLEDMARSLGNQSNDDLSEIKALVSQPDNKWTKAQVKELAGVNNG